MEKLNQSNMKVLQVSAHFAPNIGGVETHLTDLVRGLKKNGYNIFVLTYRPLMTMTDWRLYEKENGISILRLPWFTGLFNKLLSSPAIEFLYLSTGLFFICPFIILIFRPQIIHAHGLTSAAVSIFWGKIFRTRVIVSTHSVYNFPSSGLYTRFIRFILNQSNKVLCLSQQSIHELQRLGINHKKLEKFVYWIDLEKFKPFPKKECKSKLNIFNKFVVLYVGRLVEEKGIPELLLASGRFNKNVLLIIAGSGQMKHQIETSQSASLKFVGPIAQDDLPIFYSAADVLIVPSTHEEGFGRVILESLACGTPVIASNRGAIPEAMNNTVGQLITITPDNIVNTVNHFNIDAKMITRLTESCRKFATSRYSEKNIRMITNAYEKRP